MKRLYIVDDHKMMQKGVKDYLEENTDWSVPKPRVLKSPKRRRRPQ